MQFSVPVPGLANTARSRRRELPPTQQRAGRQPSSPQPEALQGVLASSAVAARRTGQRRTRAPSAYVISPTAGLARRLPRGRAPPICARARDSGKQLVRVATRARTRDSTGLADGFGILIRNEATTIRLHGDEIDDEDTHQADDDALVKDSSRTSMNLCHLLRVQVPSKASNAVLPAPSPRDFGLPPGAPPSVPDLLPQAHFGDPPAVFPLRGRSFPPVEPICSALSMGRQSGESDGGSTSRDLDVARDHKSLVSAIQHVDQTMARALPT